MFSLQLEHMILFILPDLKLEFHSWSTNLTSLTSWNMVLDVYSCCERCKSKITNLSFHSGCNNRATQLNTTTHHTWTPDNYFTQNAPASSNWSLKSQRKGLREKKRTILSTYFSSCRRLPWRWQPHLAAPSPWWLQHLGQGCQGNNTLAIWEKEELGIHTAPGRTDGHSFALTDTHIYIEMYRSMSCMYCKRGWGWGGISLHLNLSWSERY